MVRIVLSDDQCSFQLHLLRIDPGVFLMRSEKKDPHDAIFVSHQRDQSIVIRLDVEDGQLRRPRQNLEWISDMTHQRHVATPIESTRVVGDFAFHRSEVPIRISLRTFS